MTGRAIGLLAAALWLTAAPAGADEGPRLVGTVLGPGREAAAVFEVPGGGQALRRVGEPVTGELSLRAVRRGSVVLVDPAGRRVVLQVGRRTAAGSPVAGAPLTGRAVGGAAQPVVRAAVTPGGGAARGPGSADAGWEAAEEVVRGNRPADVVFGDRETPAAVRTAKPLRPPVAGLAPVSEDGRLAGVALAAGPPDNPLVRAGLEPGDIIVAVDGASLADDGPDGASRLSALLETVEEQGRPLAIEARRGGEPLRVEIAPRR